jgi:radical SAM family uncharacterized protein/radical SAM-linked protein
MSSARKRFETVRPRLDPHLPLVERPGRYLCLERNAIRKDLSAATITLALAFPDVYEIGMSHTGLKILYEIVNRNPRWACERAYAPWTDLEARMRADGIPLFSHESCAPVAEFDALGFSLQAEINYSNVLNMLDLAGLPLLQSDRRREDPIVLGGGPCTANPEPLALFFDAFLIGDAEEALVLFLRELEEWKSHGRESREEFLFRLAQIPGFYVPSLYRVAYREDGTIAEISPRRAGVPERVRRVWVERLSADFYPEKPVVPSVDIVQDRLGLEIMRGCTQGCRFCQAGYWYRPVRELDPDVVERMTRKFIGETGWSEVGLLSLSTADYSQIEPLVSCLAPQLADQRVSISLPSLRAEAFSVGLAEAVSTVRKSGFTFAPETGSDRLRRVINKTFTNADMIQAADAAFSRGWDLIKVYTMIGLPTETEADLDELVALVRGILARGRKYGRKNVNVSVGSFVPKSWTPFQWSAFDGAESLAGKIRFLRERFRGVRGAKIKAHGPEEADIECALSRGDRRMGDVLLEAWRRGVKFDGWSEHFRYDVWQEAFAACGIAPEHYRRAYGLDEILPWDVLDAAITKRFLRIEWIKAQKEFETVDCKWGHCYACGVPGNGKDTVLAEPMSGEKAKLAAYRRRAMPELARAPRPASPRDLTTTTRHYRISFEKLGDARFLSHRNTMDALERAIRAAGLPAKYSEGFNPRMRLSMGPALALGLESREEVFDLETRSSLPPEAPERINERLPGGLRVIAMRELAKGEAPLSRVVRGARYAAALDAALVVRADSALATNPAAAVPALRACALDAPGKTLRFEVNLDPSAGETATPKKVLELLLALPPAEVLPIPITREATILA